MPAPFWADEIEALEKILRSGVVEHEVDGRMVRYDLDSVRAELARLKGLAAKAAGAAPSKPAVVQVVFPNER